MGFDYPYGYSFDMDMLSGMAGIGVIFVLVYLFAVFVGVALSLVTYVFHSLSLHTIANRRGIRHGWLAWIPVCNLWVLGSISDQYQYVVKGKIKSRRKMLLGLNIGLIIGYFLWLFVTLVTSVAGKEGLALIFLIFGGLAIIILVIWQAVCMWMAYYDLYRSSDPNNAVLYLVLSIVFTVTLPFFMFACRKKDGGMPPRKQPVQPVAAYPEEPVDTYPTEPANDYPTEPANDYPTEPVDAYPTEPVEEGFAQPEEFEEE